MNEKLKLLEEIVKRNSDEPEYVDMTDEVSHYFIFDQITNPKDLETAWSLFDEQKEIRARLANVEGNTDTVPGWGYRIPQQVRCDQDELLALVKEHLTNLRPFLYESSYTNDIISFLDNEFEIEMAPNEAVCPETTDNDLFMVLYEALSEYLISAFPEDEHYEVLYNWAIYLTKCDEVASYILWPCLEHEESEIEDLMEPAAKLWKFDCRDRFWIKDSDTKSKIVYVRPPWLDGESK